MRPTRPLGGAGGARHGAAGVASDGERVALAWIVLVVAGLFEVVWAFAMKLSEGFTRFWPSVVTGVAMTASVVLLAYSMRTLPLGTAYTVWTGIGAVGAFLVGIVVLGEPVGLMRVGAAVLIVTGLVMMKLSGAE